MSNPIGDNGLKALANATKHPDCKLRSLELGYDKSISDAGIIELARVLKNRNCKLNSLDLVCCDITDNGLESLACALKDPGCMLTSLKLGYGCHSNPNMIKILIDILKDPNCSIEDLRLHFIWDVDVDSETALCKALRLSKIKKNNISGWPGLRLGGVEALTEALKDPNSSIESLSVGTDGEESSALLADSLKHPNCKITSLELHREFDVEKLTEALKHYNSGIKTLKLERVKTYQDIKALACALMDPRCRIESLDLNWDNKGVNNLTKLTEALKHPNCKLRSLELTSMKPDSEAAYCFLETLKHPNCMLTRFYLMRRDRIDPGLIWGINRLLENNKRKVEQRQLRRIGGLEEQVRRLNERHAQLTAHIHVLLNQHPC